MSRRGVAALIIVALTVATVVWLFNREGVIFPVLLNSATQPPPGLFRDIASVAVIAIAISFLWAVNRGTEVARMRAAVAAVVVGGTAVFLAWFHTYVHFFPRQSDEQIKEIVTWGCAIGVPAVLFKVLYSPSRSHRQPPTDPGQGP